MRASNYTIATLKETPSDAEVVSHQLMLRAGLTRKLASGIYSWMPMGYRVLKKVEAIIREEMDASGAQELLLPAVQPAELWQESGRWQEYDDGLLLRISDRHQRDFCFGPTHEEVITDLVRGEIKSHKQLPINFYQIQTKFRDETRPRFGVLRAREFLMKDAYSFHINKASLEETYQLMHRTYTRILDRMGLDYRAVLADAGAIGGSSSMEFHVLATSGEDTIAFSTGSDYAANLELAEAVAPKTETDEEAAVEEIATPGLTTIDALVSSLKVPIHKTVKTLFVHGTDTELVALLLRGDHQLNPLKAEKLDQVKSPLAFAGNEEIVAALGASPGSLGPCGLTMPVIVDHSAAAIKNFIAGANKDGYHLTNLNWGRDATATLVTDIRNVVEGDPSPDGKGSIQLKRGIEVGHIFQLGDKYSKAMNATVLDESGKAVVMMMGCYGMGVSRLVAAVIEQNHDDKGILWPDVIAPFRVIVIPVNAHQSDEVKAASEEIYQELQSQGVEVLLDDREGIRPGVKFADAELLGIPHRIVVGDRGLAKGVVEYTERRSGDTVEVPPGEIVERLMG